MKKRTVLITIVAGVFSVIWTYFVVVATKWLLKEKIDFLEPMIMA